MSKRVKHTANIEKAIDRRGQDRADPVGVHMEAKMPLCEEEAARITSDSAQSEAWVYMLSCNDNSLYTGWTTDTEARLAVHNAGKGAKYTKPRLPVRLVYRERLSGKNEALRRECEIKSMSRAQKLALVKEYQKI